MSEDVEVALTDNGLIANLTALVRRKLTPLLYASSSVITAMAQLLAGFVVIKWIAPEELGLWKSVQMAQVYAFLLLFGINNGLGRELPFFLGKGDQAFGDRLAATAFFCATMANLLVLAVGVGSAIFFAGQGAHLVLAILAITIQIVLAFYQQIFVVTFRSKESFDKLSALQFVEAGLSLATVPLVYFYHYNGMLARAVIVSGVVAALTYSFRPMRVKMQLDWEAFKLLLKTGVPIFGLDYLRNSAATIYQVKLLQLGGVKMVGDFYLAVVALQTLAALPKALASYLYPRMTFRYGQNGNALDLWKSGFRFVFLATGLTALAALSAWVMMPFVPHFAPKYQDGVRAAQISLVGGVLEAGTIIANILFSMKAWRLMVSYQVGSAILYALAPIVGCLIVGPSLEGVAWGVVGGALGRSVLAVGLSYYGTHQAKPSTPSMPQTA